MKGVLLYNPGFYAWDDISPFAHLISPFVCNWNIFTGISISVDSLLIQCCCAFLCSLIHHTCRILQGEIYPSSCSMLSSEIYPSCCSMLIFEEVYNNSRYVSCTK